MVFWMPCAIRGRQDRGLQRDRARINNLRRDDGSSFELFDLRNHFVIRLVEMHLINGTLAFVSHVADGSRGAGMTRRSPRLPFAE